jgi:hypothetical protein
MFLGVKPHGYVRPSFLIENMLVSWRNLTVSQS